MKQLTETEANLILEKLVILRNKSKKNKKFLQEYHDYEGFCAKAFDYLIIAKTNKYKSFANHADLQQEGRIALLAALRNFDLKKGSFFWWADQYIKTKISREANRHSTIKVPIKQARKITPYKLSYMPNIIDGALTPDEDYERNETIHTVTEALNMLSERQRRILQMSGLKDYSISQIARELKIARPSCIKILNAAKKNFKYNIQTMSI